MLPVEPTTPAVLWEGVVFPTRFSAIDDSLVVQIDVGIVDGRPACVGLQRLPDGPPLTSELLRHLPLRQLTLTASANMLAAIKRDVAGQPFVPPSREQRDHVRPTVFGPQRGRRLSDDDLRELSDVYAAAMRDGRPPTQAVADRFVLAYPTAGKRVQEARRRGFLPPTTRGQARA